MDSFGCFSLFFVIVFCGVSLVLRGQIGLKEGFRSLCVLHQSQIGQFRVSESLPITTTVNTYFVSAFKRVPFWAIAASLQNESLDDPNRQSQVGSALANEVTIVGGEVQIRSMCGTMHVPWCQEDCIKIAFSPRRRQPILRVRVVL